MRRILIISEDDLTGQRLNQLFNSLYAHEKKLLFWCSIDIVDCRQESLLYPHKVNITGAPVNIPDRFGNSLVQANKAEKTMKALTCQDINTIVRKNKIDTVLVPHFLYDSHRDQQYEMIVKNLKREMNVEIIGLYI